MPVRLGVVEVMCDDIVGGGRSRSRLRDSGFLRDGRQSSLRGENLGGVLARLWPLFWSSTGMCGDCLVVVARSGRRL